MIDDGYYSDLQWLVMIIILDGHVIFQKKTVLTRQELKYTMGQMLNAQRTAALALVTPNLSSLH